MSLSENVVIKFKLGQKAKVFLENGLKILEVASFNINYYDNTDRLILADDNKYYEYVSVDKANNIWQHVFEDIISRRTCYSTKHIIVPVSDEDYI